MKYFLTCVLGLALLLTPSLAQKKSVKSKVVNKPTAQIESQFEPANTNKNPKLAIESLRHDFGKVKDTGNPISHTFLVKNEGTADLEIESVTPG